MTGGFKLGSPCTGTAAPLPIMKLAADTRMNSLPPFRHICLAVLLVCLAVPYGAAESYSAHEFQRAQRMHASLDRKLTTRRSRRQYNRVLDAYRNVYMDYPGSPYAVAAATATADVLAEEGRVFHDRRLLHEAIGQYEYVRQQYPHSNYAYSALLNEGDIYELDLGEPARARQRFELFLRLYPHNPLGDEARYELAAIRRKEHPRQPPATATNQEAAAAHAKPVHARRRASVVARQHAPSKPAAGVAAASTHPLPVAANAGAGLPLVLSLRHWSTRDSTRVVIRLQKKVQYEAARTSNPSRIFFDLYGARLSPALMGRSDQTIHDGFLKGISITQLTQDVTRVELRVSPVSDYSAFYLPNPPRLIVDVRGRAEAAGRRNTQKRPASVANSAGSELRHEVKATPAPTTAPVAAEVPGTKPAPGVPMRSAGKGHALPPPLKSMHPAVRGKPAPVPALQPNAPTMVRALGLKIHRIVIDPGHGGRDSGTIGPNGLEEKTVALDVALRLGRLLKRQLGMRVFYTRDTDTFVPLEKRTAIANRDHADLFISIHVNSNPDRAIRGVATYYLSFTNSADALELAARENAVSKQSIHQLSQLVKKIALNDKLNESRIFARDVEQSLYSGLKKGNRGFEELGVKKAPFVVLIGANMPSILAEISFLSNPRSAHDLTEPAYRERIAKALYRGVAKYVDAVNGMRIARNGGNGQGR